MIFLDVLADPQGIEHLHVGKAFEEDYPVGDAVGVLHLLDRFFAPDLGHVREAPIGQQPVMQPILVDGSELVTQSLVKILDDFGVALHDELQGLRPGLGLSWCRTLLRKKTSKQASPGARNREAPIQQIQRNWALRARPWAHPVRHI